ncbi:Cna B-type domain-containing protein [uncultured Subdoligranulum sp.]|uniref:Cna B-type domain-containing protein n=1 Tax=uncultured Subdoligranulum sp. TaxID=512298 RepID=UPI0025D42241|nr:Cna B-type domain-containing protein [uncultured Subdoligranulum sp.]
MKMKRLAALFLAAAMSISTAATALPVYAEDAPQPSSLTEEADAGTQADGGAADTQPEQQPQPGPGPEAGAGSTPASPQPSPESGQTTQPEQQPAQPIQLPETQGDTAPVAGAPDPNEGLCPHHTEHDAACGYVEAQPGSPCAFVCPVCDCTCTSLCTEEDPNEGCPVCAEHPDECTYTTVEVSVRINSQYVVCADKNVFITIGGEITGEKVESATVNIALTEEEISMLGSLDDTGLTLNGNTLSFTVDQKINNGIFSTSLNIHADALATLDISSEDITVTLSPEKYQTEEYKDQVGISTDGGKLTFVEKLPTQEDPYGGGLEYDTKVDALAVYYVDSEGNPAARQEDAPVFTLYYQVGDGEPQALDPEHLPFGMDDEPAIAATPADDTWTGSVADASLLPSRVLTWAGDAFQEQPVRWYLQPSYTGDNTNGTLVQITEDNKDEYPAGLAVGSWYFIANPEPFPDDVPEVIESLGNLHHTVYWADNGGAEGKRPANMTGLYELQFSLDGSYQYQTLTVENMGTLGLDALPQPTLTHGSGVWEVDWDNSLPSKVRYTDSTGSGGEPVVRSVSWRFVPKDGAAGYAMVEVNEENAGQYPSAGQNYGTYFVLETSMDFYVRIYRGDNQGGQGLQDAFYDQFHLHAQYGDEKDLYFQLAQMLADGHVRDDYVDGTDSDCITVTVDGLWCYNLDNTRISYSIKEGEVTGAATKPAEGDGKVDSAAVPEEGDYFAIGYDNGEVPNYGDATDAVYGGGTVKLTLTGFREWNATKVWLDDGDTSSRPETVFELWRYRADQPYSTASLVRDDSGLPLTIKPQQSEDDPNKYILQIGGLPKYDAEGYAYLYVVREYLEGDNASRYEQVFGVVGEDGNVTDTVLPAGTERASGNTFLYRGGTLSNRLRGTVTVPVTKEWKAASFQSFFENVMVELRLQSRPAGSDDEWQDTKYTDRIFGFFAENLAITHANSYPQYDQQGRELEYRWVEEAVWQNGSVQDGQYVGGDKVPVTEENGSKIFTLTQNGRKIQYRSVSNYAEGGTVITNSIANTIDYAVEKKFEGGWDADNYKDSYTFTLFRSTSGSQAAPYLTFTMDGDSEGTVKFETYGVDEEEKNITVQRDGAWKVSIHGLPEFDAEGQQYEYMLLEKSGNLLSIQTKRDDEGNYTSVITNGPGDTNLILVRKEWIDESDSEHRLPVTVTVYDKETCEPLTVDGHGVSATLENDGTGWYAILNIGKYEPNEVYVLETAVGNSQVTGNPNSAPNYTNDGDGTYTWARVDTDYHKYEVTYAYDESFGGDGGVFEGVPCFTVTNRRLGNVDITVTKNWVDGDGDKRTALAAALDQHNMALAVRLDFLSEAPAGQEYKITRSGYGNDTQGDTVTISPGNTVPIRDQEENPVDSIQVLDLSEPQQKKQTLYFWNLPKYDGNGAVVRYTVEEIFVNEKGEEVSEANLPAAVRNAWQDYQATVTAGEYEVGHLHADDKQGFTIQNALSGTTTASWYTLWQDQYAYDEGYRPDIYLNIYARTHVQGVDGTTTRTELFVPNYRWEYDGKTGEEDISQSTFWKCTIENLPKYDELGYEIDYFALMSSTVSAEDFGYLNSQYAPGRAADGSGAFGTSDGVDAENKDRVQDVGEGGVPNYALQSGNTFINTLYGTISVRGEKLWQNLPDSYPMTDLPTVTFYLDRATVGGQKEEDVAYMTVTGDDWKNLLVNGQYVFAFGHTGANAPSSKIPGNGELPQGTALLPRFDTQGRLYTYTVREVIEWDGTAAGSEGGNVFTLDGSGQTLRNSYNPDTAQLSAVKYLTVPKGLESYPAITLQLTRTYTTNDETPSKSLTVQTQTWNAADVKTAVDKAVDEDNDGLVTVEHRFDFNELPVYAPNGSEFVYTITEDKSSLGGYDTWAADGDVSAEDLEKDAYKGATSVGDLRPNKDSGIDASFLNKKGDPGTIELTGAKVWQDLDNAFDFRPEKIEITLQRRANSQPGQSNPIDWQDVTLKDSQIAWDGKDAGSNRWTYTITGLERYAPNGMPWIYQVTETAPEHYTASPANGTVQQRGVDANGNVTMNDLTNSILTSKNFRKTWVDSQGRTITQDILGDGIELEVKYALQVRAKAEDTEGADYGLWQDASAYFAATLPEGDTSGLRDRAYTGSIRATLSDAKWKQSYYGENNSLQNLPLYIKGADGPVYELEYRVVETEVNVYPNSEPAAASLLTLTYTAPDNNGDDPYTYEVTGQGAAQGFIMPYYGSNGETTQPNKTANHKNQLDTTELTIRKVWVGDNNNAYGTRPATDADRYTWQVTLVIQRSTDGATWTDVQEVTLYGTDDLTQAGQTVTGLPVMVVDADGDLTACQYRVQELQPGTDDAVEEGGAFHGGYTVAYPDNTTATNTLHTVDFTAQKKWNDNQNENGKRPASITLELKYLQAGGDPAKEEDYRSFAAPAIVTLDGKADGDSGELYYEDKEWHAVWNGVPAVMPGSSKDASGNTVYKVFERVSGDYIIESSPATSAGGGDFTITNTPSITLSVDKIWLGLDAQTSVTVELRRTVDGGTPEVVKEVTLNEGNHWRHTFDPVPVYDGDGKKYQYTVAETEINGNPAEKFECGIAYGGNAESGFHIYNYKVGALYVIKDWADDALPEGRPVDLTLKLYRTTVQDPAESDWQEVTGLTYTWNKNGDRWYTSFNDLAMVDVNGNPYTYRVEEVCPDGYEETVITHGNASIFHFKNTLSERISIPVRKVWVDNNDHFGWRPGSITVELYANGEPTSQKLTLGPNALQNLWNFVTGSANGWSGTFTGIPKYDQNGALIEYSVVETPVPDHYEVSYGQDANGTFVITNSAGGDLIVSKRVTGEGEDGSAQFHFTVQVSDDTLSGTFGDMTFTNGTASVTLRDGEQAAARGLPAGLSYTVTEAEADRGPYTTASTGEAGTIPAGGTATAEFANDHRVISIPVEKVWQDDGDRDGLRPQSITVKLLADGADAGRQLTLDASCGWKGSFGGLDAYRDGKPVNYTVEEVPVEGYQAEVTGDAASGFVIINGRTGGTPAAGASGQSTPQAPQTGDGFDLSLLVTLNLLSLLGMAGLILGARRKKRAARK